MYSSSRYAQGLINLPKHLKSNSWSRLLRLVQEALGCRNSSEMESILRTVCMAK